MKKVTKFLFILFMLGWATASFGERSTLKSYVSPTSDLPDVPGCDSVIVNYAESDDLKIAYEYDNDGNKTTKITYTLSATHEWEPFNKYIYTYHSNGIMASQRRFEWTETHNGQTVNNWMLYSEFQFDKYGNETGYFEFYEGDWDNRICNYSLEQQYEYDSNGKILSNLFRFWYGESYSEGEKREYTYDTHGNLTSINTLIADDKGGWRQYVPRFDYEYDEQNREIRETYYNSISGNTLKPPKYKWETQYNEQGLKNYYTQYEMGNSDWKKLNEKEYTYDPQGNEVLMGYYKNIEIRTGYIGNVPVYESLGFKLSYYLETKYDEKNRILHQSETDVKYTIKNKEGGKITVDVAENLQWKTSCYYANETNIEFLSAKMEIAVFPNPASEQITISGLRSGDTFYFYSFNGQLLFYQEATSNSETVSVGHLPTGNYFVKTSNGDVVKWIKK